nr:unnamed protein product [Trichobilharzia regenti]
MFFVVNLIREMRFDNPGKQVIYFTDDVKMSSIENFVTHHTGLSCAYFKSDEQHIGKCFSDWLSVLQKYDVILLSPWLIPIIITLSSINFLVKFIHQCAYLLVADECHMVLDSNHPLSLLFGPNGPMIRMEVAEKEDTTYEQTIQEYEMSTMEKVRILCFTSALLPREITDPQKARLRLETLERRTNCRLETASELLTMLSLGARPQEHVIFCPKSSPHSPIPFHQFMLKIFREIKEFINDIELTMSSMKITSTSTTTTSTSIDSSTRMVTNAGGFRVCVLDYCKRAINQCEEIFNELGLWCAAQIVRVFAKHLIALDRQRTELIKQYGTTVSTGVDNAAEQKDCPPPVNSSSTDKTDDGKSRTEYPITITKINDIENRISYLLRHTVTQMCFLSRLFQMEFDSILTLTEFQSMVSPKVLRLIEQLKLYKPNMNFRIEVAELPNAKNSSISIKSTNENRRKGGAGRGGRGRRSCSQASRQSRSSMSSSMGILSCDVDSLSDSMSDTMSSLSDDDEDGGGGDSDNRSLRSLGSKKSRYSTHSMKDLNSSSKRHKRKKKFNSSANIPNFKDLHFVPASTLNSGGMKPDIDPSTLIYRAVLDTDHDHDNKNNQSKSSEKVSPKNGSTGNNISSNRLCGLIIAPCQFSAYALSRLIDELCIWDVDLYFIKIAHLFCRQTLLKGDDDDDEDNKSSSTAFINKAKQQHTSNFNSYKSLVKFGNEPVNNDSSSTNPRNPFSVNQEETITNFRRGAINLLVATQAAISAVTTSGSELPRCNLVIALRLPNSLAEYLSSKARSRLVDYGAKVIYLIDKKENQNGDGDDDDNVSDCNAQTNDQFLGKFQQLEQLLIQRCRGYSFFCDEHDVDASVADKILPPIFPRGPNGPKFYLSKAINVINQYCARLPSDHITSLTPKWYWKVFPQPKGFKPSSTGPGSTCGSNKDLQPNGTYNLYQCVLRLPINSSIKETIVSEPMACKKLAKFSAALNAINLLYMAGEMDTKVEFITTITTTTNNNNSRRNSHHMRSLNNTSSQSNQNSMKSVQLSISTSSGINDSLLTGGVDGDSEDYGDVGSSYYDSSADEDILNSSSIQNSVKRRQYYYRKFPYQMSNCLPQPGEPSPNYLYYIDVRLVNPFPGQQNNSQCTRQYHRPEQEPVGFGILTTKPIHHIPIFPIFSRSGEERIRFIELWSPKSQYQLDDAYLPIQSPSLTEEQIDQLIKFHRVLFQEVLRFEKDSVLEFNFEKAYSQILVVPTRRDTCSIDWDFVNLVLTSFCEKSIGRLLPRRLTEVSPEKWKEQIDQIKLQAGVSNSCGKSSFGVTGAAAAHHHHHPNRIRPGSITSSLTMNRFQRSSLVDHRLNNKSGTFEFREEDFINAVVTPGYRNLDQPQYYYVEAIKYDMSPLSPFPSTNYRNFAAYYINKYNAIITTNNQPLLDVDLTVIRLNLIIPRYMNIHGQNLMTSSNHNNNNCNTTTTNGDNNTNTNNSSSMLSTMTSSRKHQHQQYDHRDHLTHKQLLIPELCFRHTFPASVWRKAVCIPSILYRLEHLLLAEELRHRIAYEINLGCAQLPEYEVLSKEDFVNCYSAISSIPMIGGEKDAADGVGSAVRNTADSTTLFEPLNFLLPVVDQIIVNNQSIQDRNYDTDDDNDDDNNNNNSNNHYKNARKSSTDNDSTRAAGSGIGRSGSGAGCRRGRRKQNYRNLKRKNQTAATSNNNNNNTNKSNNTTPIVKENESDVQKLSETVNTIELSDSKKNKNKSKGHEDRQNDVNVSSDDGIGNEDDDGDSDGDGDDGDYRVQQDGAGTVDDSSLEKPTVLKLHATSASVFTKGHLNHTSNVPLCGQFGSLNPNLESLLQETKVIELNSSDMNQLNNDDDDDEDGLKVVENYVNMDKEYLGSDSDTESVDSFEGNVRFFPPEDDDDDYPNVDDAGHIRNNQSDDNNDRATNLGEALKRAYRPGPATVLQALTMSCSNDFINLERMETIGDSFLKFVVTVHLYLRYPAAHEGKLSHLRSRIVCNTNLHRLGKAKDLQSRMVGGKFEPHENWVPPGYYVRRDKRLDSEVARKPPPNRDLVIWSTDTLMDDEVLRDIKVIDENKIQPIENFTISEWDPNDPKVIRAQHINNHCLIAIQQAIPDKSIADCVEALIGCYLTTRGERSALRLMQWFGINCVHTESGHGRLTSGAPWISPKSNYLDTDENRAYLAEARLVWRFDELEATLNYTFRDPSLLIQAFTHPSYHQLRVLPDSNERIKFPTDLDCYQRLEFLGDAVLDYVITRFLYEDSKQHSPGILTDLRSALVNNNIFAALAVRIGLHRYFRASSPQLLHTIDVFVRYQKDVAKDDLDFITNEEIEIRQPELVDTFIEETMNHLTSDSTNVNTSNLPKVNTVKVNKQKSKSKTSRRRRRPHQNKDNGDDDNDDDDGDRDEDDVEDDDEEEEEDDDDEEDEQHAPLLNKATECESRWQAQDTKELTGLFVQDSTDNKQQPSKCQQNQLKSSDQNNNLNNTNNNNNNKNKNSLTPNRLSDDVEIPKALGDIFESLAGAIFLDSNFSLDTVWQVFYPIMKERIERYTACIPKSPVRQLLELEPEGTKFERPRRMVDGRISVCAHVLGKGRFYGVGRNYRLAKSLAAKRALRVLRQLNQTQTSTATVGSAGAGEENPGKNKQ